MSAAQLLGRPMRCQSCQWQTLNAFASAFGLSLNAARPAAQRRAPAPRIRTAQPFGLRRTFATRHDADARRFPSSEKSEEDILRDLEKDLMPERDGEPEESQPADQISLRQTWHAKTDGKLSEPTKDIDESVLTSNRDEPKVFWKSTTSDLAQAKADPAENEVLRDIGEEEALDDLEGEPTASQITSAPQDPTIPWYLQVEQPEQRQSTLAERQQLPELPEDAPEKMPAIMEHLFTDIGLDDLRMLDLRKMDPPQALGANLIMIFGTARSEKHLHTSADRFCRWLRSSYKLRPYADGLLGRNELKIRLRRKAKRAKLLGSKGTPESEVDDGIRTGWVCVNVGSIEKGEEVTTAQLQARGIVGFGEGSAGAHLVVQMMTEEKREELDLEKLWSDAMARQERKEARMDREDDIEPAPKDRPTLLSV